MSVVSSGNAMIVMLWFVAVEVFELVRRGLSKSCKSRGAGRLLAQPEFCLESGAGFERRSFSVARVFSTSGGVFQLRVF
jgi:hypothetical protein